MQASRRVLFSLIVALVAMSAPIALPSAAQRADPQAISVDGGRSPQGHCHKDGICGD